MLALVAFSLKVNVMVPSLVAVMAFTDAICVLLTEMFVLLILTSPPLGVSIESVSDASLFAVICMASVPPVQLASSSASVILELIAVAVAFSA